MMKSLALIARTFTKVLASVLVVLLTVTLMAVPQPPEGNRILPQAQAQTNPPAQSSGVCGSSVAFLVDLSNSLTQNDLTRLKSTLKDLVRSLEGAPYDIALYTFGTHSPFRGTTPPGPLVNIPSRSLQTQSGFNAIMAAIDAMYINTQGQGTGGTSWAGGLQAVANDMIAHKYQVVYFITDGQPTYDIQGNANRAGNSTERVEIDQALEQKGRIEQAGGKVIPVGIGTSMYSNGEIDIYDPWLLFFWRTNSAIRHQALLTSMTTVGKSPIVVQNYDGLKNQLIANFATGCVQVVKEIVDAEGNILQNGSSWKFDLSYTGLNPGTSTPAQVATGTNGAAEFAIQGVGNNARVTISEVQQQGYDLMPAGGNNARCMSYRVGGGTPTPVAVRNVGDRGVSFGLDETRIIVCTFQNRASVPLKLSKTVTANSTILQEELNNRTYSFDYSCRVGTRTIAQGRVTDVAGDAEVSLSAAPIPVGAKCTITETQPEIDEGRYGVKTYWSVTNGTVSHSGPGLTTEVTVGREGFSSGTGTTVQVTNSYETETATISMRKRVEGDAPEADVPGTFRVQYSCRYVPDINNPPEQNPGSLDPYFVVNGYVHLPSNGDPVTIPVSDPNGNPDPAAGPLMFPVGAQCELSEAPSADNPIDVKQFDLSTKWHSDICLSQGSGADGLNECNSNYIYVDSAGTHDVRVVNAYTRQVGSAVVRKLVTGDAESRGNEIMYKFALQCTDGFVREFEINAGGSYRVDGVPVGVDCTVTEQYPDSDIPDVDLTLAANENIKLQNKDQIADVSMTNTLMYKTGEAVLHKDVVIDPSITDPIVEALLLMESFPVTGVCEQPDGETVRINDNISDGGEIRTSPLPLGTICRFTEQDLDLIPEGVELVKPGSVTIEVREEGDNVATLVNMFRAPRADLRITKDVDVAYLRATDLDAYIPREFEISYTCGSDSGTLTLADGESGVVEGIAAGTLCEISETILDAPEVERAAQFFGVMGVQNGDSYSFTFPVDGGGASIVVNNQYRPAVSQISLNKQSVLLDEGGTEITDSWSANVIDPEKTYPITYTCKRQSGYQFPTYTENVRVGHETTVQAPVGADCVIDEISQPLPGTTGPVDTYSLNNGVSEAEEISVPVNDSQSSQTVDIRNEYRMQYGTFSLKKKVDGEGVATIPAEKDFKFSYVCTLGEGAEKKVVKQNAQGEELLIGRFDNGADFTVTGVPLGADCVIAEDRDSAAEPEADLTYRWTVADSSTGWGAQEDACTTGVAVICSTDSENTPNEAAFRIVNKDERTSGDSSETQPLPENFQGTFVLWNTYTYHKTILEVDKTLTGDGLELAGEDDFTFQLVCTHPTYAKGEFEGMPFIQDPTITQSVSVPGDGQATAPTPVPVGYQCSITESQVNSYDATVTTTFSGEGLPDSTTPRDPAVSGGATEEFVVTATGMITEEGYASGDPQQIIVNNHYERPRAQLTVAKQLRGSENLGNVNAYINSPETFSINWVCTDQYIENKTYSGTLDVTPGDRPTEITLDGGVKIPQTAHCTVTEVAEGKIPVGFEDIVNSSHGVHVTRDDQTVLQQAGVITTGEISLDKESATVVEFTNSYWVEQEHLGFAKYIEGDPDGVIFPAGAEEETRFGFDFRCEVTNLLPGQPVPVITGAVPRGGATDSGGGAIVLGSFTLGHGGLWSTGPLPTGSTCHITEQNLSAEAQQRLDDNGLKMQPNYVYPAENPDYTEPDSEDQGVVREPVVGEAPRIQLKENETVPLGGDYGSYAWLLNSLYRAEGEVQVHKVSHPDDQPLPGAQFAIYELDRAGEGLLGEVVAENLEFLTEGDQTRFVVRLKPGSYLLVETRSGTGSELLPAPWRFDVSPTNEGELGDLEFALSAYDQNSGLIEVVQPQDDPKSPWIIKVANVESGELPLTGGIGIWKALGVGGGLLLLALFSWFGIRRCES